MEICDLYTKDREFTGRTMVRGDQIPDGCYHLGVQVWIRNSEGKYLISQRSASRKNYPLFWETVGGAVVAGENTLDAAIREVKEEVNIELCPSDIKFLFTDIREKAGNKVCNAMGDIYLANYYGNLDTTKMNSDEVGQSIWMTKNEIRTLYEEGKLVETLSYFFEYDYFD